MIGNNPCFRTIGWVLLFILLAAPLEFTVSVAAAETVLFRFKFDPRKASGWERIRYGAAKLIYGEYPPHSALNYIWSSRVHSENIITNSYTDRAQMILLRKGVEAVGQWLVEEVDIIEDYQKAFGQKPPPAAGLAVMGDADNTGEKATAFLDFIEIYRPKIGFIRVEKFITAREGQFTNQRQLTTFKVGAGMLAGTGVLTFCTAAGSFALPRRDAAPHPLPALIRPINGL